MTYQAEQAAAVGPTFSSAHPGFTGRGYLDYQHAAGDYIEFVVDAAGPGAYALDFLYANGGATARALELRVDGQVLDEGLSFAPTGAWRNWATVTRTVLLAPGRHTVRLTAVGQSGPNLDALTVTPGAGL